jgi:hypothetical protein
MNRPRRRDRLFVRDLGHEKANYKLQWQVWIDQPAHVSPQSKDEPCTDNNSDEQKDSCRRALSSPVLPIMT